MREKSQPIPLIIEALAFAAFKHRDQRRKDRDATPYINHPIALTRVLTGSGIADAAVLCAALLHDTVEDTDTTFAELEEHFGAAVAALVRELTDDKTLPKTRRKQLQIDGAADLSREAKLVKLADKICNLRDLARSPPTDWPASRIQDYVEWATRVVNRLRGTHIGLEKLFDDACRDLRALE